jgi:serine/threonine-protein kinase
VRGGGRTHGLLAGRYEIGEVIGSGGMATVYLAVDRRHGRRVAVKVLRAELCATLAAVRFHREIGIAARLTHPHILPLYDSGETAGCLYYVMPYVPGESLRHRMLRGRGIAAAEAVRIVREVAEALDYAHRENVVHRDVKPENILLVDGHPVVADFGIARAISAAAGPGVVTRTNLAVGTPRYMSPEQAAGRPVDGRSDIFSLACVLHELLTGEPPETACDAQAATTGRLAGLPTRHRLSLEQATPQVRRALARALAQAPEHRFPTAGAFAQALGSCAGDARRRPASRAALLAAGLLVLAGGLGAWLRAGPPPAVMPARLAVLDFETLGPGPVADFVPAAREEIAARLVGLEGLRVVARRLPPGPEGGTVQQLGARLGADYLLEATVSWQRTGARDATVRVRPRLVRVCDGTHVWAEVYTLDARDAFAAETRLAQLVSEALAELAATGNAARCRP